MGLKIDRPLISDAVTAPRPAGWTYTEARVYMFDESKLNMIV
jgi:hypothetical protein